MPIDIKAEFAGDSYDCVRDKPYAEILNAP
ncbi:MAG: hypothetical protein ACJA04_000287 [Cellvibrionaceae bacterium]|jgi:hypothetical protein